MFSDNNVKLPHFCFDWQPFLLPLLPSKLFLGHCCWHFWFLCFFLRRLRIVTYFFHSNGFTIEQQYKFLTQTLSSWQVLWGLTSWISFSAGARLQCEFVCYGQKWFRFGVDSGKFFCFSCLHEKTLYFSISSIYFIIYNWFSWH